MRIIVRTDYAGMAANVGGSVLTEFRTFDVSTPEVEAFLAEKLGSYDQRQVIGVERRALADKDTPRETEERG